MRGRRKRAKVCTQSGTHIAARRHAAADPAALIYKKKYCSAAQTGSACKGPRQQLARLVSARSPLGDFRPGITCSIWFYIIYTSVCVDSSTPNAYAFSAICALARKLAPWHSTPFAIWKKEMSAHQVRETSFPKVAIRVLWVHVWRNSSLFV